MARHILFAHKRASLLNAVLCTVINVGFLFIGLGGTGDFVGAGSVLVVALPIMVPCSGVAGWVLGALGNHMWTRGRRDGITMWFWGLGSLGAALLSSWVLTIVLFVVTVDVILPMCDARGQG